MRLAPCKNCGEPQDAPKKAVGGTACDYYEPALRFIVTEVTGDFSPRAGNYGRTQHHSVQVLDSLWGYKLMFEARSDYRRGKNAADKARAEAQAKADELNSELA